MVVPCAVLPTDCSGWPASCFNGECYSTPTMVRQQRRRSPRSLSSTGTDIPSSRPTFGEAAQRHWRKPARNVLDSGSTVLRSTGREGTPHASKRRCFAKHSNLITGRKSHEVHERVFGWVLALIAERGLVRGERIGVDASTLEANAALRAIVRRDTGAGYREMLERMAQESGIATPTAEDLIRLDRKRKSKTLSNEEWVSRTDPEARIARMKDGTTHLAYKPEHAIDLDTGAVVAAEMHPADQGDTTTLNGTLDAAQRNLTNVGAPPSSDDPAECVADKGYHARAVLKDLDGGPWKTRIAEPQRRGVSRWHGDADAGGAVYNNRTRLRSEVGKQAMRNRAMRNRAELVERSFAHILDRRGMRRTWLRGRENVHKRYLIHVAGHNLGLLMRLLIGAGTPKEAVAS